MDSLFFDQPFQITYGSTVLIIRPVDMPGRLAFHVSFSSERKPLLTRLGLCLVFHPAHFKTFVSMMHCIRIKFVVLTSLNRMRSKLYKQNLQIKSYGTKCKEAVSKVKIGAAFFVFSFSDDLFTFFGFLSVQ